MPPSVSRPAEPAPGREPIPRWHLAALGVILLAGISLRWHDLTRGGLWMDELWAASFVQLGFKDLLVAVVRFDVHPPAYYIQLNAWAALFGRSDTALLANSVAWSTVAIAAIWWTGARILDPMTGLLASALTAASGSEVFYAQELRMYAMIGALTPIGWYLAECYAREPGWGRASALIGGTVPLALAHGASVVPMSCIVVYLAVRLGLRRALQPRNALVFVTAGLITLPAVANSAFRGVSHTQVPDPGVIGATVAGWLFGYHPPLAEGMLLLGSVLVIAGGAVACLSLPARRTVLAFVFWPVVFVLAASFLMRPLWIARLMAFCAPFACIGLASAITRIGASLRLPTLAVTVGLVGLMIIRSLGQGGDGRKMEYREAAAYLRQHAVPGDLILIPEHVTFWGIARYFAGPSWGSLLAIQDPVRPGESRAWDPVYARLGPDWLRWLNLIPERRVIETDGRRLMIGNSPDSAMHESPRLWVVGSSRVRPEAMPLCPGTPGSVTRFRGLAVSAWSCTTGG